MIALVRHPAIQGAEGICYGRLDFPLAAPERDIALIAQQLRSLSSPIVYSSPAGRCRVVAEWLGFPVRFEMRLQELDFGAWEGRRWCDVSREALDQWAADPLGFAPPNGESGAQLIGRISEFAAELRCEPGDRIVVTHGGPLKVLMPALRREAIDLLAPSPPMGSVNILTD